MVTSVTPAASEMDLCVIFSLFWRQAMYTSQSVFSFKSNEWWQWQIPKFFTLLSNL